MSVISHARIPLTTVNYRDLSTHQADQFDTLMTQADTAATNDHYLHLMAHAALTAGIQLPPDGEITKCACTGCYCDLIFAANHPDARPFGLSTDYNLGTIQCPNCADDHLHPGDE